MGNVKPSVIFAIGAWSLLILRFGYRFGTGDQVELLPYTLFLHNHSLYPHDFFIQGLNAAVPNERTVMATLLLPFVNHLEIFCFIFHFLSTIFLVLGLEKLTLRFIHNKYFAWFAVLLALIPLNNFTLGDVDLTSDCIQASSLAVAFVVWGINFFLDKKFIPASVLMVAATFIHVLEGLNIMLVLCAIMLFMVIIRQTPLKTAIAFSGIYALTAGVFLMVILFNKSASSINGCVPANHDDLFKILFQFRHPHHYIFASFPKIKAVVYFILTLLALIFFSEHSSKTFEFVLVGSIGIIVYAFAVDDFHNIFITNFQFYRITPWIKFLGVIAGMGLVEEFYLSRFHLPAFLKIEKSALIALILTCWIIIFKFNQLLPYKVPFQLFGLKEKDDMISICEQIKEKTPADAVFIQPFDNTELKFYAQRSSFVDFKAFVHHACYVDEWYRRIQLIYGVSADGPVKGFALQQKADDYYYHQNLWQFNNHSGYGITYLLVKKEYTPPLGTLILSNNSYAVYKL